MCMVLKNSSGELESQSATTRGASKLSKNEVDQSQPMNENSISSMSVMWILLYVAFCTIIEISRQKEARNREYALLLSNDFKELIYSVQYHRHHCTLQAFEQFRALYLNNPDDKYPTRPGFEPSTSQFWATIGPSEPSGPASISVIPPTKWTKRKLFV